MSDAKKLSVGGVDIEYASARWLPWLVGPFLLPWNRNVVCFFSGESFFASSSASPSMLVHGREAVGKLQSRVPQLH